MRAIRWLHLSDFHQGMGQQPWLWPTVKGLLFEDLEKLRPLAGPWDVVFFTGDLTQRGSREQFEELDRTLEELLAHLARLDSRPVLFAVPGNHDLVRPNALLPEVRALREWHRDDELREAFWSGAGPAGEYRKLIDEVFAAYREWDDRWQAAHPAPEGLRVEWARGELPGDFAATVDKGGLRLGVVGLNSSFLQLTDANYKGKLDLDPRQLRGCGKDPVAWAKGHHAALLLTHHPIDWLHKGALARYHGTIATPGLFAAHLHGHMHEGSAQALGFDGFAAQRFLQASSLFGLEHYGSRVDRSHGYAAGALELEGAEGTLRVWPRAATPGRRGVFQLRGDPNFKLGRDESFALPFAPNAPAPPSGRPGPPPLSRASERQLLATRVQPPGAAYDARWYVEREVKHRDALSYLRTPGKPVVLLGSRQAGKTWMMKHVLELARQDGAQRLVKIDLRLFAEAMGTHNALLGAIAQHLARGLNVDRTEVARAWTEDAPATQKLTWLMEDRFLRPDEGPLALVVDETDELLGRPARDDFFGMLRSWAESANDPPWSSLRVAIAASTKNLTKDVNKSPFQGLSEPIEVDDLDTEQVGDLADRYGLAWGGAEIATLMGLVGGHPYLARLAMYEAAAHGKGLEAIVAPEASTFRSHLESCRQQLPATREFLEAFASIKRGASAPLDDEEGERLTRYGIVVPAERGTYRLRYPLYGRV